MLNDEVKKGDDSSDKDGDSDKDDDKNKNGDNDDREGASDHLVGGLNNLWHGLFGGVVSIPTQMYQHASERGVTVSLCVILFCIHLRYLFTQS